VSRLVIDASLALSWLLPDETSDATVGVRNEVLRAESVWVAAHWHLEVCNSLWMAERRKRLGASGVAQAVALFTQLSVLVDAETQQRASSETLVIARQHAISVYDAAYLELALRRGAALGSLDELLRTAADRLGVSVLPKKLPDVL
jgi:predicted nucleic acid-binding protein